jgi:Zn finger protein HypA/HybF involved in hydrogenase expression
MDVANQSFIRGAMYGEIFNFQCLDCGHLFRAEIGTPCPNCGSIDVKIIVKFNLKRKLMNFFK